MKNGVLIFLCLFSLASYSQTTTVYPQSGNWFNFDDPGTGIDILIQNGIIAGNVYGYDSDGGDTWLQFAGRLQRDDESSNFFIETDLNRFSQGRCVIDCDSTAPDDSAMRILEVVGQIRLDFESLTTARFSINNSNAIQIRAFNFGVNQFADDVGLSRQVLDYTGEWSLVVEEVSGQSANNRKQSGIATFNAPRVLATTPSTLEYDLRLSDFDVSDLLDDTPDAGDFAQNLIGFFRCRDTNLPAEPTVNCQIQLNTDDDNDDDDDDTPDPVLGFNVSPHDMTHNYFVSEVSFVVSGTINRSFRIIGHRLSYGD